MALAEAGAMTRMIAVTLTLAFLFIAVPASAEPQPLTETRAGMCHDFPGLAFGFCVALCEARECDRQPPGDERCGVLRRGFDRATGGVEPPC
jgi:hypothetical protein